MQFPSDLKYSKSHEWVRVEGGRATVGITDYAQDALGDVVYVELPSAGKSLEAGASFGVIESVKAAEDLYAPVSGAVVSSNQEVIDTPEIVNRSCYQDGWMLVVELSDPAELDALLGADDYQQLIAQEQH